MGIKTVPQPPYNQDLAPCDFWLFCKHRGCRYETIEEMKGCDESHWHAHTRGLPWGLPEVVGVVQQMHCSWRRLLQRGLEFHVCTINKSAHMKKVWKLIVWTSYSKSDQVCLFVRVLWHINLWRLFNAKSIFMQINSSISNNSVLYKYSFLFTHSSMSEQFYFKQFSLA